LFTYKFLGSLIYCRHCNEAAELKRDHESECGSAWYSEAQNSQNMQSGKSVLVVASSIQVAKCWPVNYNPSLLHVKKKSVSKTQMLHFADWASLKGYNL